MGIGMNGDDIVLKLSMDMKDLQKSLSDLYRHVQKTMDDVEEEFSNSAKGLSKLTDAVKDFQGDVNKHFNKVKDSASDTSTHMVKTMDNGFGKIISGAKKVASALAIAFSVREIAQFGRDIVEASADLEAMQAQFEQVMQFKDAKGNITNFADEATDRLNKMRSEWDMELNTIKGDYSAFVSQFKGLGLDMEQSLDSSDTALTLAADAAAMYNISMQEAIEHVRSFVKGNYIGGESIQLFGSENMMKAWLEGLSAAEKKAMGLNNEWKDMAENEKQLVRLNFAKEQQELAGTTGQAARESGLYQNQLTKLKQKWTDFKAVLGTKALEGVTGAFKTLSEVMENIDAEGLGEGIGGAIEKIVGWFDKIDWFTLSQQIETIWGYLKEFFGDSWNTLKENFQPVVDAVEDIFSALGLTSETEGANTQNMDAINKFLLNTKDEFKWLADHGEEVADALTKIVKAVALWKGLSITLTVASFIKGLTYKSLAEWIVAKLGLDTAKGSLGASLLSGLSGAMPALVAVSIPLAFSFTFEWWGTDEQKEQVDKRLDDVIGIDSENLNVNLKFDLTETKKSLKKTWNDIKEYFGDLLSTPDNFTIFGDFKDLNEWLGAKLSYDNIDEDIARLFEPFQGLVEKLRGFADDCKLFFNDPFAFLVSKTPGWLAEIQKFKEDYIGEADSFSEGIGNIFGTIGTKISSGIINALNSAISSMETLLNKIIGGINSFFDKVGIDKEISTVSFGRLGNKKSNNKYKNSGGGHHLDAYAKGTDNAHGGLSLVGEAGRELVVDPRLGAFMANSATLLNLSKGATVLSNKNTEKFLKATGIKAFAKGKNEDSFWSNIWNYASNPEKILEKIIGSDGIGGSGVIADGLRQWFSGSAKNLILEVIKKAFKEAIPDVSGIGSVSGWIPLIHKAASFFGETLTGNELARVLQQIRTESGGRQNAVQSTAVWDINAQTGNLAKGLLQYVPSTFNAYKVKGFGDIYNGYHQLLAFFNNSSWRKALPQLGEKRGWTPRGRRRAKNGILVDGATPLTVGEAGQEAVVPLSNARALKPFGQSVLDAIKEETNADTGGVYEFTIPLYVDGREIAKATASFTKQELDKLDKRNNRLNGRK